MVATSTTCPSCNTLLPAEAAYFLMCGAKVGIDPLRDALDQAVETGR